MARAPQTLETAFRTFHVIKPINEGAAGRVYRVADDTGCEFAAKVLHPDRTTKERRSRFKNEIGFCQRIRHPNIVSVNDYGVVVLDGRPTPFYVMKLYEQSLRGRLESRIAPESAIRYFSQLLDGVEAAHLQKVVHRDLKPENALIDSESDSLVVADFGIAHFEEDLLLSIVETAPSTRLANFQYAAPEQKQRGGPVGFASDIYALGLMLNELFTGRVPAGTDFLRIGAVAPAYSYLDDVVDQMIRQDPSGRPTSIDAIKSDLIGRKREFVTRQRLDAVRQEVVPASSIADPLLDTPVRVIDFEWAQNTLTLVLSQPVNQDWITAFQNIGSRTSVMGADVTDFAFRGDRATVRAEDRSVQDIIDYFKGWLPRATQGYETELQSRRRRQQDIANDRLRREREELERQLAVRRSVKL